MRNRYRFVLLAMLLCIHMHFQNMLYVNMYHMCKTWMSWVPSHLIHSLLKILFSLYVSFSYYYVFKLINLMNWFILLFSEEGKGHLLYYSFWKVPWTDEPGRLLVHGVTKSRTWLRDWAHRVLLFLFSGFFVSDFVVFISGNFISAI